VATILELAGYADISAENVLRVLHGEAVSEDVERRVQEAIDALGAPAYPRRVEVLPAVPADAVTDELLQRVQSATAELEANLPQGVGSVIYEALRVEVRPVAQHVAELGALFEHMLARLDEVSTSVGDERRDRLEDVALLTELVTSGWRSVDRRLARLEQIVARIESGRNGRRQGRLYRLDDAAGTSPGD
jgi:polyhydroxyalkanoate synthesis regulator phasin